MRHQGSSPEVSCVRPASSLRRRTPFAEYIRPTMQYHNGSQAGAVSRQVVPALALGYTHAPSCPSLGQSRQTVRCSGRTWRDHKEPAFYRPCLPRQTYFRQQLCRQPAASSEAGKGPAPGQLSECSGYQSAFLPDQSFEPGSMHASLQSRIS